MSTVEKPVANERGEIIVPLVISREYWDELTGDGVTLHDCYEELVLEEVDGGYTLKFVVSA